MDIEKILEKPKRVEVDGQVVETHGLGDVVEFDRYLSSKKAMLGRKLPVRFTKMVSGGAQC